MAFVQNAPSGDINNDWLGLYELAEENVAEAREFLAGTARFSRPRLKMLDER